MDQIDFVTWDELLAAHQEQLRLFGGQDGFIDEGVVRSAMARPLAEILRTHMQELDEE